MTEKEILSFIDSSTTTTTMQPVFHNTERTISVNPYEILIEELADIKVMLRFILQDKNTIEEKPDLIDVKEASELTHLSVSSIYKKTSTNTIPFIKRKGSNKLIFSRIDLNTWLKESDCLPINLVEEHLHRNLQVRKVQNN